METPPDRKYAVFISYRHADNKEQGRQWATWLHHTLETYEVPPDLVGRTNLRGEPVPASLYPVFRDEEELPADADLSANIQRALRHSALLVVLCSPRAVESRFVSDEIKIFKELGKSGHILALMIDGEPNASDDPGKTRAGIRPEQECLPESLRYGVPREDGSIDWTQRTEPIAADVRPENKPVQGWTTAAAYREELTRQGLAKPETDRLSNAYDEQLQLATMKIIAWAIGLPLDEVTQRDKRRAEDQRHDFIPGQIRSFSGRASGVVIAARLPNNVGWTSHTHDPETGQFTEIVPEVVRPDLDENIQFTVFRPEEAPLQVWCDLLAFAHLGSKRPDAAADEPDPLEEVERQARQFLGSQLEEFKKLTQDSSIAFPQDGEITFAPESEQAEFNPPRVTFLWKESVHRESFRFRITSGAPGEAVRGCLNVFLGPFLAATVTLRIKIAATAAKTSPPATKQHTVSAYRNIFVSYSHRDKAVVDICQHYAKAFGDRFLRDCVDLRAGQKWNPGLLALIDKADVFQLFWSTNARESEYVRQEVAHALRLNRAGFIRPTYWESEWPEPWNNDPDLSDLHFERLPFGNKLIDPPVGPESSPTHGPAATAPDIGNAPIMLGNASTDTIRISLRPKVETQMEKQTTAMSEEEAVPLAKAPESTKVKQAPAPLPKATMKMAQYGAPPAVAAPMRRAECRHEDAEDWYEEKDCEAGLMPLRIIFSIVMGLCSGALAWFYSNQAELQNSLRHSIALVAVGIGLGVFFGFFFFPLLPKGFKKVMCLALCVGLCAATWWIITRFFH